MNTKHEILLLPEVAERLRVSTATVNRLLAQRRKGTGTFPLPISTFKGRGRWVASDIDSYIESLSNVNTVAAHVPSKRQQEREHQRRQESARTALARHGIKREGA